jgi:hypothetical protein
VSETSRVIKKSKKQRKFRVKWPKGFDPRKPGPMPDPERWIHKLERIKGKKKATGYRTATQGVSNVDMAATKSTFQTGPSTANVEATVSSSGGKKGGKKNK